MQMRFRRYVFALIAALAAVPMLAVPVAAHETGNEDGNGAYLAIGDSISFGTNPLVDPRNAANFTGFPTPVAQALDLAVTNPSCPGEASGGFISFTGTDNVCRPYRANFPLHVNYTTTQLAFTVHFLKTHHDTRLVTFEIGANDLFVLVNSCTGPPPASVLNVGCVVAGVPALLAALKANLDTIYGAIRNNAHYHGLLVGLTYYSGNYADPVGTSLIGAIDSVLAERTLHWGGVVADGFGAFAIASHNGDTCAAGLRIPLPAGGCDVHPTVAGRNLLAAAVVAAVAAAEGEQGDHNNHQEGDNQS